MPSETRPPATRSPATRYQAAEPRPDRSLVGLGLALALACLGPGPPLLGAVSGGASAGTADGVDLLSWYAVAAPAVGFLAAWIRPRPIAFALAVPGVWGVALALLEARARVPLPAPFHGFLVVAGLFALGLALGLVRSRPRRGEPGPPIGLRSGEAWAGAGVLLLVAALASGLASRGGLPGRPLPPAAARRLLDLSPVALTLESAGADWMRHPAVYDPAGTDRFVRAPYRGSLAGPLALLVGCASAALAHLLFRRAQRTPETKP